MMNKIRKLSWAGVITVLAVVVPSVAQDVYNSTLLRLSQAEPAGRVLGADDTDVALLVMHVSSGTENSGLVAVAADGDITFTAGAVGAEASVDDFECPVSGGLGGVIDVSDTACNTLGEVVDVINGNVTGGTKGNWVAVILDGQRSDSSDNSLLTFSATSARSLDGLALPWDTDTVGFRSSVAMVPAEARKMGFYTARQPDYPRLVANPFINHRSVFLKGNATSTYGSGTSTYNLVSVKVTNAPNNGLGAEVATTLYAEAGGATTANKVFDFSPYGVYGYKGEKLLARLVNSAAMASTFHAAYGLFYRFQ